jgi:hypothetical protein
MKLAIFTAAMILGGSTAAIAQPAAAGTDVPPCSRTVTDHCIQTGHGGGGEMGEHHRHHHHGHHHHGRHHHHHG